jgi:Transposase DDE domain
VFRLALRQTEGLIGSLIGLLGLALAVPDHSTLSRRAKALEVLRSQPRRNGEPLHLLVDSTGLKLCGTGEWLIEKHGIRTRRSWRQLHIGLDGDTGQIVAAALTAKEVDDGAEVGPLLPQIPEPVASFIGDGADDQDGVSAAVAERHPEAAIIVPPRATAVPSDMAQTAPTQRGRHLQHIAEHGRRAWQSKGRSVRARASKYCLCPPRRHDVPSCGFQDGQYGHGPTEGESKHLGQIAQAEFIAQTPEHHERDHVGRCQTTSGTQPSATLKTQPPRSR